jgi:hypothetical protein
MNWPAKLAQSFLPVPATLNTPILLFFGFAAETSIIFGILFWQVKRLYDNNLRIWKALATQREKSANDLLLGLETERQRIARELHDDLGVQMAALKMKLSILPEAPDWRARLDSALRELDTAHSDLRDISHNLAPRTLEMGLYPAIESLLHRLNSHGMDGKPHFHFFQNLATDHFRKTAKIHLFRITQELLANVVKHASATEATLQFIAHGDEILVTMEDDGVGFDPEKVSGHGIGLSNISHRVMALNGQLSIDSWPGRGATISITIPVEEVLEK